jgi:hypothetical protein
MLHLDEWESEQLVFLDEIAINEYIMDCIYDWISMGIPIRQIQSIKRIKKWSILPIYTIDDFLIWEIIHGSYDHTLFISFLKIHIIPNMNPFPGLYSILIMDNTKIHRHKISNHYPYFILPFLMS